MTTRSQRLKAIWYFNRKISIPSLLVSIPLGFLGSTSYYSIQMIGVSFLFISPLFQFFIYDLGRPQEYIFYMNVGLSRIELWASTLCSGLLVAIFLSLL
jgi:hypothetical protein